jgi:hypothetical protein
LCIDGERVGARLTDWRISLRVFGLSRVVVLAVALSGIGLTVYGPVAVAAVAAASGKPAGKSADKRYVEVWNPPEARSDARSSGSKTRAKPLSAKRSARTAPRKIVDRAAASAVAPTASSITRPPATRTGTRVTRPDSSGTSPGAPASDPGIPRIIGPDGNAFRV